VCGWSDPLTEVFTLLGPNIESMGRDEELSAEDCPNPADGRTGSL